MPDSLSDLLKKRDINEPPEVKIIKSFVQNHFQASCQVGVQMNQITISVNSAPLAGALRTRLYELQELCDTKKRLTIRIE